MRDEITDIILRIIHSTNSASIEVATLGVDDDLYALGLKSLAAVRLMLELENEFGVEFPNSVLHRGSFSTVNRIRDIVAPLLSAQAEASAH